jgi:glutamate formiminotransferase/glutamate formiminotransferase/formiminotetrahydrofolate cyclodeaminase
MPPPTLLAVPNVSEGRDASLIELMSRAVEGADGTAVRLLDVHSDGDHDRSVFTFAAGPRVLADAILRLAGLALEAIDLASAGRTGQHPHVGALDVAPVVYLRPEDRGAACAEALVIGERIGAELELPVFLYGELTADGAAPGRTRASLRRGGVARLAERMTGGGEPAERLVPDFGPAALDLRTGATLVAAREPLVAFNLQLVPPATLADARRVAAIVREGGAEGLPGLRAIGVALAGGVAQVSMNVERPLELALAEVVRAVASHVAVADAELVGLAPAAALEGFPEDLAMPGFDPARQVIENALGC